MKNPSGYWGITNGEFKVEGKGSVKIPKGAKCPDKVKITEGHCVSGATDLDVTTADRTYWSQLQKSVETANGKLKKIALTDFPDCSAANTEWVNSGILHLPSGYYDFTALQALNNLTASYTVVSKALKFSPKKADGSAACATPKTSK